MDWEHTAADRPPTHDMFMLLSSYPRLVPDRGLTARAIDEGFEAAWLRVGTLSQQCWGQPRAFPSRLGIDPSGLAVLLVDFLLAMIDAPSFGGSRDWPRMFRGCAAHGQLP